MYSNPLPSSVKSLWLRLNHYLILGFPPRFLSCASLYREYTFFIPLLMSYQTPTLSDFFYLPVLDTEVFSSRHLIKGSGSPAKHFRRVFEIFQEVFRLRIRVKNLALFFFLCFLMNLSQSSFCFRSQSRSRVLTAKGLFMDFAASDTVYNVDPTPYLDVRVLPSTSSVTIHPAFYRCHRSFLVNFSALWASRKPVTELVVNTDHWS